MNFFPNLCNLASKINLSLLEPLNTVGKYFSIYSSNVQSTCIKVANSSTTVCKSWSIAMSYKFWAKSLSLQYTKPKLGATYPSSHSQPYFLNPFPNISNSFCNSILWFGGKISNIASLVSLCWM